MRGDAFIHFVSGSRRVNIRLGVLLLIPKSPHLMIDIPVVKSLVFEGGISRCWPRQYTEQCR